MVDNLAEAGYLTIAPEFYHRHAKPGRWLECDDSGRQEGFTLFNRLDRDQALTDVDTWPHWSRSQPGIERVAMIGFSAGGHLSYLVTMLATRAPRRARPGDDGYGDVSRETKRMFHVKHWPAGAGWRSGGGDGTRTRLA